MMNIRGKMIVPLCLVVLSSQISLAYADDVTIEVNGSVVAKPCTISTKIANVDLGDLHTFDLISPGSSSEWHSISLDLINCPVGTSVVTAKFSGVTDTTGYYKNQGNASNIQLQLQDLNGNNLNNGAQTALAVDDSSLSVHFPLQVRALSVKGQASQGSIQSIIDVAYTYQ